MDLDRPAPSKLDPHKAYLEDWLKAGVWNTQVLLREIRAAWLRNAIAAYGTLDGALIANEYQQEGVGCGSVDTR